MHATVRTATPPNVPPMVAASRAIVQMLADGDPSAGTSVALKPGFKLESVCVAVEDNDEVAVMGFFDTQTKKMARRARAGAKET